MLLDIIQKGSVDKSVELRIIDSTDGTPETAVVFNTSGIDLWYRRQGEVKTSITEATLAALTTAHSDGGFLHIGDGVYRLDLPDAAWATGAEWVSIGGTVTGMVVIGGRVRLVDFNSNDAVRLGLTALPNANAEAAGGLYTRGTGAGQINQANNGNIDANTVRVGGTAVTARDIGASVLISSGTGTGQLDVTAGVVKANLAQILGTALTETAGQIAGGFKKVFDVASPVFTALCVNQSGDSFARLGAPAGASVSADIAAIKTDTGNLVTRVTSTIFSGITSLKEWLGLLAGKQVGNSTARTEIRSTGAGSGTFDETTDSNEATRDNTGTAGAGLTALGDARVANLDATVSSRASASALATVQADTDDIQTRLPAALVSGRMNSDVGAMQANTVNASALASDAVDEIWAKAMTELSGVPGVNASTLDALRWLFLLSRNKITQTATTQTLRNDADASNVAASTVSDDGTTFTRGKFA